MFLKVLPKPLLIQFWAIPVCPVTGYKGEDISTSLSTPQEAAENNGATTQLPFLQTRLFQSPQSGHSFHTFHQLCLPPGHSSCIVEPNTAGSTPGEATPALSTAGQSPVRTSWLSCAWCAPGQGLPLGLPLPLIVHTEMLFYMKLVKILTWETNYKWAANPLAKKINSLYNDPWHRVRTSEMQNQRGSGGEHACLSKQPVLFWHGSAIAAAPSWSTSHGVYSPRLSACTHRQTLHITRTTASHGFRVKHVVSLHWKCWDEMQASCSPSF